MGEVRRVEELEDAPGGGLAFDPDDPGCGFLVAPGDGVFAAVPAAPADPEVVDAEPDAEPGEFADPLSSARAIPGLWATAVPIPRATANAASVPTCRAQCGVIAIAGALP